MISRPTTSRTGAAALLLASTALLILPSAGRAAPQDGSFMVAQAPPPAEQKKPEPPHPAAPPPRPAPPAAQPPHPPAPPPPPPPRPQAPPPQPPHPAPQPPAASPPPRPQAPAPAAQPPHQVPPAVQERREERREQPGRPPVAAPPPQPNALPRPPAPGAQPPTAAPERIERRPGPPPAPAAQPPAPPPQAAPPRPQSAPQIAPQPLPPAAQQPPQRVAPPAAQNNNPAFIPPPVQRRDASEFLRRPGQPGAPPPHMDQIRQERQEVREGNRVFIREGDRTIEREGNRVIIRHNEANRFAIGAANVVTERRGVNSEMIIERGNGVRIINVTDANGRLLRRIRRDASGREIVILDSAWAGPRFGGPVYLDLPPPIIRIPRERYILDADRADPAAIYGVLAEPPVEVIDQPYTLEQVRFNAPLRDRMPRIDLDINFDLGSWQLTPDQIDRLGAIADAINRMLQRNPREVFMIEGYTDATGNPDDNLSLSDRRAEAAAVALTEQFQVPAENLVTQGYGAEYLKIPTDGPERLNRRVAVRRITPLIDRQAANVPPPPPR